MTERSELTPQRQRVLRTLAALIIPASELHAIPGAGDDEIFAAVLRVAARASGPVAAAIEQVREWSREFHDCEPEALDESGLAALVQWFQDAHPTRAALLASVVSEAYYQDDRVLTSLGVELRPPFPGGYEVDDGDWRLLDPVRARAPFFRPTPDR